MPVALPAAVQAWIPGVLEGLVSHTLFSLLEQAFHFPRRHSASSALDDRVRNNLSSATLTSIVGAGPLADGSAEELRQFLSSQEASTIVRQIYSFRLTDGKNGGLESIRQEFINLLGAKVRGADNELGVSLFGVILGACDAALDSSLKEGSLFALDAKQTARHRIFMDELSVIKSNLDLLAEKPNVAEILDFEERYRKQVAARHDSISPAHLDRLKKFPIDSLYVAPRLAHYFAGSDLWPRQVTYRAGMSTKQFLPRVHRAVLLGNPGAGKSTFTLKLCHDLATTVLLADRRVTPILVVLRDFGAQKKEKNYSILQFIEMRSAAWYQVQAPQRAFEYLLLNGHAIIIFDGLDELLETGYRREIADDIESFCNLYPSTPTIVTSRMVGYEQAPLNRRKFEPYGLLDFDEEQVREYAGKWFATDDTMTKDQRTKRAETFLYESRSVPDLRANPLMLSLMCNIYLGEDFIPTNRPEVYKKCALMLFDRWDRSRRISTGYAFENQLSPIMTHIAHWLYSQPGLQSGVTEQQLVQECARYLHPKRFEYPEEAEKAAVDFIEFCRGRAWVFSDTGTTPTGVSLYQFTHRTFLEYFTALFLFRNNPKPSELLTVLRPRIAKREWDVVAQLAFHIASREVEGGGDELMLGLLSAHSTASERLNLLTFASRCMEFVSCSPKTSRAVTEATLDAYLTWASKVNQSGKLVEHSEPRPEAADLIGNLLHTGVETRSTVAECVERLLCEKLGNNFGLPTTIAAEIVVRLSKLVIRRSDTASTGSDLAGYWEPVRRRILESNGPQLLKIYSKELPVALASYFAGSTALEDLVAWHGTRPMFKKRL